MYTFEIKCQHLILCYLPYIFLVFSSLSLSLSLCLSLSGVWFLGLNYQSYIIFSFNTLPILPTKSSYTPAKLSSISFAVFHIFIGYCMQSYLNFSFLWLCYRRVAAWVLYSHSCLATGWKGAPLSIFLFSLHLNKSRKGYRHCSCRLTLLYFLA
jgi:hypothetical protein